MISQTSFHGRRAVEFENDQLRIVITQEGGHIAGMFEKAANISPLWIPPWTSVEPSNYSPQQHPEYGLNAESKLLAGIMGHNLCLDLFGPPSDSETQAGLSVHGEGSIAPYKIESSGNQVVATCALPMAQLSFARRLQLTGRKLSVVETVENLSPYDRPIAWQQHVTLGPPFLAHGETQVNAPIAKAAVKDSEEAFAWPHRPDGSDLMTYTSAQSSGGYTAQLLKQENDRSWFFAFSPGSQLALGYVWTTADFPWLGMWEENHARQQPPWNGRTLTLGMEFGTTPFPETRREMIDRGSFFGTPAYRWLRARSRLTAEYYAALLPATKIPATLEEFEALSSKP